MQTKGENQATTHGARTVWYDSTVELPIAPGRVVPRGVDVVGFGLNTIDLTALVERYPEPDTKHRLVDFAERPGGPGGHGHDDLRPAGVARAVCRTVRR